MNRQVQIYIEGQRLELFNDEKITINSSVQNISDISKTYTDFSQSFTIPASVNNNKIFQYFYLNEVDATLDYNIRRSASIEIDLIPFRTGKIQLEKAQLKNGQVDNYTITFYGDLVTLKDLFGEDKLNSLDYTAYTHIYTGANVQTRISSDSLDYDVRWPLISSSRVWQYGGGGGGGAGSNNIASSSHPIVYTELFPALRVSKIFNEIENKYGINFTGNFITNKRFTDVFLYLKNREVFNFWTQNKEIDLNAIGTIGISTPQPMFDLANNKIVFTSFDFVQGSYAVQLNVTSASPTTNYIVDIYENDILINSFQYTGTDTNYVYYVDTDSALYTELKFKIRASESCTVTHADLIVQFDDTFGAPTTFNYCSLNPTVLTAEVDLASNMPDMKVADFFSGVLKQFNMACIPASPTSYELLPLETWYATGTIRDITKYTDKTDVSIDRMPLYKRISFEHEQSQSFMNRKFYDLYTREYGDLNSNYTYDGGDYIIKLPFENLNFNKFTSTNLQVGYCLTPAPDFKPYIPKPILLYKYNKLSCSFHFNNGTSTNHVLTYIPFGQDLLFGGINYSLNFGNDQSTLLNENIERGIYFQYYSQYLTNLYNPKSRFVTIKANLPVSILRNIKLNDRLVIRDKRYIINDMQTDLTSGDVTFKLIQDFRNINYVPK
jgi:hypothetical protein